jgi:hypothetical protein
MVDHLLIFQRHFSPRVSIPGRLLRKAHSLSVLLQFAIWPITRPYNAVEPL